jgi:hypothetical protein
MMYKAAVGRPVEAGAEREARNTMTVKTRKNKAIPIAPSSTQGVRYLRI